MDSENLIQRGKEKDPKALDIIYRTYYPLMVGVCMNITREDRATADDLVHDAFILAFVSIGSLRDNSKFHEWLTSIVRNVSLKYIEQRDRVHILPISAIKGEDAVFIDSSSAPDEELNYKELLELISQLPEGYSRILRLSVIEGFSHKEIAEMLGIEPHSSSSQLSRAKRFLRRLIDNRMTGLILLLLLPLAWYFMFRHGETQPDEVVQVSTNTEEQTRPEPADDFAEQADDFAEPADKLTEPADNYRYKPLAPDPAPKSARTAGVIQPDSIIKPDADSLFTGRQTDSGKEILAREAIEDSLDCALKDSLRSPVILPEINVAEVLGKKKKTWQFLAAGSLGPSLAQNVYKLIATNRSSIGSGYPDPDAPTVEVPAYITTWEEYSRYLKAVSSPAVTADTLELIEIAQRNTGRITQKEHHDKPITFGISLTKSLPRRWTLETGLQYSILNSQFSMGENGDSIATKQRIHYLGIPLRASYRWIDYKRLSLYSSVGLTMHIPVYGKVRGSYYNDCESVFSETKRFNPSLQWQTGVSLGMQYEFAPHTSLFAEPSFNWFIPSGSHTHTAWTEKPFMFTCPFGVRITW